MSVRIYVPASVSMLRDVLVSGGIGPVPVVAHAVTDSLRASHDGADEEELEYAALTAAAQDSVAMMGADDPPRRVVLVAEVGSASELPEGEPSLVEVGEVVPLATVVAVHADSADAAADVAAARAGLDGEDEAALALLDRCLEHELGWYATQEAAALAEDAEG